MNYWLIKSEPTSYSIDDLARDKQTFWNGVRNYQARNFIREMKKGDKVLFYHSGANPPAVVGFAQVSRDAYPDSTALDPKHHYYDPKATSDNPIWMMVDVKFISKCKTPLSISVIKHTPALKGMMVTQPGSRLSVQPVSEKHFAVIEKLSR